MKPLRAKTLAMQGIFHYEFNNKSLQEICKLDWVDYKLPEEEKELAIKIIIGVIENLESIDNIIKDASENWKIERISSVNLSILRMAVYQLQFMKESSKSVKEHALKLGSKFSEKDANRFLNGLIEKFIQHP